MVINTTNYSLGLCKLKNAERLKESQGKEYISPSPPSAFSILLHLHALPEERFY